MANPPPSRIAGAISRLSPKHRQYLILGLGIGAFLLLVFGGVAIWDKPVQLPQGSNPVTTATDADCHSGCSSRSPGYLDEQERGTDAANGGHDPGLAPAGRYARQETGVANVAHRH
jgi:hypothetical protein